MMIYMDNGATTRVCGAAREAMLPFLEEQYGNPSASCSLGRKAQSALRSARREMASAIGGEEKELLFVSNGSEANALALCGFLYPCRGRERHIVVSAIEHSSVLKTIRFLEKEGVEVSYAMPDANGFISPDEIERLIRPETVLVSVMYANNETGVIQPVSKIGEIAHENGCCFHCDAVAAAGHRQLDVQELHADLLTASGHKFGGPKGSGFLYLRKGRKISPMIMGGEQEHGLRAGTENVPAIAGMQAALRESLCRMEQNTEKMRTLREELEGRLKMLDPSVRINGEGTDRLESHSSVTFPGISGERLRMFLDMDGICVSGGAACMTGSREVSHVLLAMGRTPEDAESTVRFTLSPENEFDEIRIVTERIGHLLPRCRK